VSVYSINFILSVILCAPREWWVGEGVGGGNRRRPEPLEDDDGGGIRENGEEIYPHLRQIPSSSLFFCLPYDVYESPALNTI
jgi:hypothetical protein